MNLSVENYAKRKLACRRYAATKTTKRKEFIKDKGMFRPRRGRIFVKKRTVIVKIRPHRGRTSPLSSRFYKYAIPSGLNSHLHKQTPLFHYPLSQPISELKKIGKPKNWNCIANGCMPTACICSYLGFSPDSRIPNGMRGISKIWHAKICQ